MHCLTFQRSSRAICVLLKQRIIFVNNVCINFMSLFTTSRLDTLCCKHRSISLFDYLGSQLGQENWALQSPCKHIKLYHKAPKSNNHWFCNAIIDSKVCLVHQLMSKSNYLNQSRNLRAKFIWSNVNTSTALETKWEKLIPKLIHANF